MELNETKKEAMREYKRQWRKRIGSIYENTTVNGGKRIENVITHTIDNGEKRTKTKSKNINADIGNEKPKKEPDKT